MIGAGQVSGWMQAWAAVVGLVRTLLQRSRGPVHEGWATTRKTSENSPLSKSVETIVVCDGKIAFHSGAFLVCHSYCFHHYLAMLIWESLSTDGVSARLVQCCGENVSDTIGIIWNAGYLLRTLWKPCQVTRVLRGRPQIVDQCAGQSLLLLS